MKHRFWSPLSPWALSLLLLPLLLPLTEASEDPISNCRPKGSESILCENRERLCKDLGYNFTYSPELVCGADRSWYYDPEVPCQCKVMCINLIPRDGDCAINMRDYPAALCAPGLDCLKKGEDEAYTCRPNPDKDCVGRQLEYEEAVEGGWGGPALMEPACDGAGQWAAQQCSAQATCYCVAKDGSRLFGEDIYTRGEGMDCQCAEHWARNDELSLPSGLRCLPNGNFDPLQCNEDFCYCMDASKPSVTQGPYPHASILSLECFNSSYHSFNYSNPCEVALQGFTDPTGGLEEGALVVGVGKEPQCSPDGFYGAVQPATKDGYFCSDRFGDQIEDFEFSKKDDSQCYCATRLHLLSSAGLTSALPQCCSDGSYQQPQEHGLYAYCVDEYGNQDGDVTTITEAGSLQCQPSSC